MKSWVLMSVSLTVLVLLGPVRAEMQEPSGQRDYPCPVIHRTLPLEMRVDACERAYRQGNYEVARKCCEDLQRRSGKAGSRDVTIQAHRLLARVSLKKADCESAVKHYLHAQKLYELSGEKASALRCRLDAAATRQRFGMYEEVLALADESMVREIQRLDLNHLATLAKLIRARTYHEKGKPKETLKIYDDLLGAGDTAQPRTSSAGKTGTIARGEPSTKGQEQEPGCRLNAVERTIITFERAEVLRSMGNMPQASEDYCTCAATRLTEPGPGTQPEEGGSTGGAPSVKRIPLWSETEALKRALRSQLKAIRRRLEINFNRPTRSKTLKRLELALELRETVHLLLEFQNRVINEPVQQLKKEDHFRGFLAKGVTQLALDLYWTTHGLLDEVSGYHALRKKTTVNGTGSKKPEEDEGSPSDSSRKTKTPVNRARENALAGSDAPGEQREEGLVSILKETATCLEASLLTEERIRDLREPQFIRAFKEYADTLLSKEPDQKSKDRFGRLGKQFSHLIDCVKLAPNDRRDVLMGLAHVNEVQERWREALDNYRKAVELEEELRTAVPPSLRRFRYEPRIGFFQRMDPYKRRLRLLVALKKHREALVLMDSTRARGYGELLAKWSWDRLESELLGPDRTILKHKGKFEKHRRVIRDRCGRRIVVTSRRSLDERKRLDKYLQERLSAAVREWHKAQKSGRVESEYAFKTYVEERCRALSEYKRDMLDHSSQTKRYICSRYPELLFAESPQDYCKLLREKLESYECCVEYDVTENTICMCMADGNGVKCRLEEWRRAKERNEKSKDENCRDEDRIEDARISLATMVKEYLQPIRPQKGIRRTGVLDLCLGRQIAKKVLDPVLYHVPGGAGPNGRTRLIIIPSETLQGLPFEVLPVSSEKEDYFGDSDQYEIVYSPSLLALRHAREQEPSKAGSNSVLLVANPGKIEDTNGEQRTKESATGSRDRQPPEKPEGNRQLKEETGSQQSSPGDAEKKTVNSTSQKFPEDRVGNPAQREADQGTQSESQQDGFRNPPPEGIAGARQSQKKDDKISYETLKYLQERFKSRLTILTDKKDKKFKESKAATEKNVRKQIDRFKTIAFFTHGWDPQMLGRYCEPNIQLAKDDTQRASRENDGHLSTDEIDDMHITADPVALIVCQSGIGWGAPGEGAMSVGRAFLYSGARSVISTLWDVHGPSADPFLMVYLSELDRTRDKLYALRVAREVVRGLAGEQARATDYAKPEHWAPYILIGDPGEQTVHSATIANTVKFWVHKIANLSTRFADETYSMKEFSPASETPRTHAATAKDFELLQACERGSTADAERWLKEGANIHCRDITFGATPLHWAAYNGHEDTVRTLIARGASVNTQSTKDGRTPLILAAGWGRTEVVKVLLEHHARPDIRDRSGLTANDWAVRNQKNDVVNLLTQTPGDLDRADHNKL